MSRAKRVLRGVVFAVALCVFLYSGIRVLQHFAQARASREAVRQLAELAVTVVQSAEEAPGEPGQNTASPLRPIDPDKPGYTAPAEEAPVVVDFERLRQENEDIIAWLYSADTPISYPVTQADDNSYYLHRLPNGEWNAGGTLFMDCRGAGDFTDSMSVIYGHNMNNDSMFGTLTEYSSQSYYEEHPVMYLMTPSGDWRIELVAGFSALSDAEFFMLPHSEEQAQTLVETALSSSAFDAGYSPAAGDRYIAFSTCSYAYDDARFIVLGVMRKIED